jgi:hypothetical protein
MKTKRPSQIQLSEKRWTYDEWCTKVPQLNMLEKCKVSGRFAIWSWLLHFLALLQDDGFT